MSALTKYFLLFIKNKRARSVLVSILFGILMLLVMVIAFISIFSAGSSSSLAEQAEAEYEYWQSHTIQESGYSCPGEKYCSHFNYPTVDWCCIFVGYCADAAEIDKEEIGYSINTGVWKNNLIKLGKYEDPDTYQPRRGNVVLFDYSGRAHHDATGWTAHIGIVVGVSDDGSRITVIAGNESGVDGNYACTSRINKYELSKTDYTIACYGSVGTDMSITTNTLNTLVRDIISHNEIGCIYSELTNEYGTVIPCDVNAISVGVYGWHANNALELLRKAHSINPSEVTAICNSYGTTGVKIKKAIVGSANWSSYIPDNATARCIKAILLTKSGKQAQDELSLEDAQKYIDICKKQGLDDPKCIAYCCDILNQWGMYSFEGGCLSGVTGSMSLSDIYNSRRAWSDSRYNYYNRRTWTYNYIKDYNFIASTT